VPVPNENQCAHGVPLNEACVECEADEIERRAAASGEGG
jgi:hypothetical protein